MVARWDAVTAWRTQGLGSSPRWHWVHCMSPGLGREPPAEGCVGRGADPGLPQARRSRASSPRSSVPSPSPRPRLGTVQLRLAQGLGAVAGCRRDQATAPGSDPCSCPLPLHCFEVLRGHGPSLGFWFLVCEKGSWTSPSPPEEEKREPGAARPAPGPLPASQAPPTTCRGEACTRACAHTHTCQSHGRRSGGVAC